MKRDRFNPLGSICICPLRVLKEATAPAWPFGELLVRIGSAVPVATAVQFRPLGVVPDTHPAWLVGSSNVAAVAWLPRNATATPAKSANLTGNGERGLVVKRLMLDSFRGVKTWVGQACTLPPPSK